MTSLKLSHSNWLTNYVQCVVLEIMVSIQTLSDHLGILSKKVWVRHLVEYCHTNSCLLYKLSGVGAYGIQTLNRRGVRVRVGLWFSIDKTIGGQVTAGDHSWHYSTP